MKKTEVHNVMKNNSESKSVASPEPYPPIKVSRKNPYYANMLYPALRAQESEMTAITTYLYQHWILTDRFSDLGKTLMAISNVEMFHLNTIGQLITMLGGDPRLANNACECWNADAIDYCQEVHHILAANIVSEEGAAAFYQQTAKEIQDPCVSAVLKRLALDEILHAKIFREFLESDKSSF